MSNSGDGSKAQAYSEGQRRLSHNISRRLKVAKTATSGANTAFILKAVDWQKQTVTQSITHGKTVYVVAHIEKY